MEELIRFRWLNDQLNNDEFTQFMSECIKSVFSESNGRSLFTKMLFKGFENSPDEIIPFTKITTNIINARESKPNQEEIDTFDKFDDLPSEIILECASFLETTDYVHFGHSNRKIYKSIYLPSSKIPILSRDAFIKYPQILSMKRFKNIKTLSIDLNHFNKNLSSSNQSIWKTENKLNTLEIDAFDGNDIIQFIQNKQMDLSNIRKLELIDIDFVTISFCNFISHFPNIECLLLYDINSEVDHDVNDENVSNILKSIPNLKHLLYSEYSNISPLIVTAFNDKLEGMALQIINDCDVSSSITFPKLRELYLYSPNNDNLSILDRTQNLKTAKLEMNDFYDDELNEENMKVTKQFINKVIDEQLFLEHLKFDIYAELFHSTISDLESAIFASINNERKSKNLLIEFEINDWESKLMQNMDLKVMRLVHLLTAKELKLDDFRIKIKMKQSEEFDKNTVKMKKWLNELETLKKTYFIQYGFIKNKVYEFTFSISNENCKIHVSKTWQTIF